MTIDTKTLRRTHVEGWRPRQSVEIDVETLKALLDELDELRARRAESDHLDRLAAELDAMVICIGCGTPTEDGKICASCADDLLIRRRRVPLLARRRRRAESDHLDRLAAELDAMVICIGCGTPTEDGKICASCADDLLICEECGAPATVATDAAWFCRACAADLPDAETPP